jgi:ketosteroid isomerase-like protein
MAVTVAPPPSSKSLMPVFEGGGGGDVTQIETDVIGIIERMTAAFQAGDLDAVMGTYEPGAAVAFEPGRPVSDPVVMRETFAAWMALSPRFDYSGHEVLIAGDLAVHVAPWTMRGRGPDGSRIEQRGLSVAVLRRQPSGDWLMVIDNPHGQRLMENAGV